MRALMLFMILVVCSCAPQSENYTALPSANNMQMAEDTVEKLVQLYPPASTRMLLPGTPADSYGQALEEKLRARGYAVQAGDIVADWLAALSSPVIETPVEEVPHSRKPVSKKASKATHKAAPVIAVEVTAQPTARATEVALHYLVDPIGEERYRLAIMADSRVLSRVYARADSRFGAAGAWSLKE